MDIRCGGSKRGGGVGGGGGWLEVGIDLFPQIHPESPGNGVSDVPDLKLSGGTCPQTSL